MAGAVFHATCVQPQVEFNIPGGYLSFKGGATKFWRKFCCFWVKIDGVVRGCNLILYEMFRTIKSVKVNRGDTELFNYSFDLRLVNTQTLLNFLFVRKLCFIMNKLETHVYYLIQPKLL